MKGLVFWPIPAFDGPSCAFGADERAFFNRRELPEVPRVWQDKANALFFSGGELPDFAPQVDKAQASRAIRAWLSSWAPAHEAKIATVAYAMWLWTTPAALDGAGVAS